MKEADHNKKINAPRPFADEDTWKRIYDTYAPLLYGTILRCTEDLEVANEILLETFLRLRDKRFEFNANHVLIALVRFCHRVAVNYLAQKGIPQKEPDDFARNYPVLNCVLYQVSSLKEAEIKLLMDSAAMRKKLHEECRSLQVSGKQV